MRILILGAGCAGLVAALHAVGRNDIRVHDSRDAARLGQHINEVGIEPIEQWDDSHLFVLPRIDPLERPDRPGVTGESSRTAARVRDSQLAKPHSLLCLPAGYHVFKVHVR